MKKPNLRINEKNIDIEILQQAQHYYEWSYSAAEAENIRDNEKELLDIVSEQIETEIRKNSEKYFDKTPTETAIRHKVNSNSSVRLQRKKYNDAKSKARLLKAAEKSFEMRKSMLEAYVYRINRQINSEVNFPKDIKASQNLIKKILT